MSADTDLAYLSGSEALARFRSGDLSPVELFDALAARADQVEGQVNAFSLEFRDHARNAAERADKAYRDGEARPLEGLMLAVKDDTSIEGQPTTSGSLIFRDNIDDHTNPSVQRLIDAGAIVHARTTCPEFVWPWSCTSRLCGTTHNPWNLEITCGASSGGSAAALAAGTTTLATGTDSGGSIRMPAGMCGIVGFKPPYGRNPNSPAFSFDFYNHIGPMTRSVADAALMQNIMAGQHPLDHASVAGKPELVPGDGDISGMRIAMSVTLDHYAVDADILHNTRAAAGRLAEMGAQVEEVATPWATGTISTGGAYGSHLYSDWFQNAVENHPDLVCDYTKVFAMQNAAVTAADHHRAYTEAGKAWIGLAGLFETFDALICPTVATTRVHAEIMPWDDDLIIDGQTVSADGAWVMTRLFNIFSRCPVVAMPSGLADNGVPAGLQIAARPFDDATAFRIAQALEMSGRWYESAETRPGL